MNYGYHASIVGEKQEKKSTLDKAEKATEKLKNLYK